MRFVTTAVRFPCRALVNNAALKPQVYWECRDTGNEEGLDTVKPDLPTKLFVGKFIRFYCPPVSGHGTELEDCIDDTQKHYD